MSSVGFTFDGNSEATQPRTISKVVKAETFLVAYTDGAGKQQARLALRLPSSNTITYLFQERVGGQPVIIPAHSWFHKAFVDKLSSEGLTPDEGEVVGAL